MLRRGVHAGFNPINITTAMQALSKSQRPSPDEARALDLIQARAAEVAGDFPGRNVGYFTYLLGKMGARARPHPLAIQYMLVRATEVPGDFNAQAAAMFMWGLATLRIDPPHEVVAAVLAQAESTSEGYLPQHVSMLFWALSRLPTPPRQTAEVSRLWETFARKVARSAGAFAPQNIENLLSALVHLALPLAQETSVQLQHATLNKLWECKPQDLCNILNALSNLGAVPPAPRPAPLKSATGRSAANSPLRPSPPPPPHEKRGRGRR